MEAIRLPDGRAIPVEELTWTFARASGPGGQSVNTTDSAVRLTWNLAASRILDPQERERLQRRLAKRIVDGEVVVTAREHRSQWANRQAAIDRLVQLVSNAIVPPGPGRRPTKPSAGARARRLSGKRQRGAVKQLRQRPGPE